MRSMSINLQSHRALLAGGCVLLLAISILLYSAVHPTVHNQILDAEGNQQSFELPLPFKFEPDVPVTIRFDIELGSWLHPTVFGFACKGKLKKLKVNGRRVQGAGAGCGRPYRRPVDLSNYVRSGLNTFEVKITTPENGGGFDIAPSRSDPLYMLLILFTLPFLGILTVFVVRSGHSRPHYLLWIIIFLGLYLRWYHMEITPWTYRAPDVGGHVDYTQFVSKTWKIPFVNKGWQSYHPPLYYYINAIAYKISPLGFIDTLRTVSLLITFLWVGTIVAVGRLLFSSNSAYLMRCAFTAVAVAIPGAVFFGGRISNDPLVQLLFLLALYLALRWWETERWSYWFLMQIAAGLAMLTKHNAVVLVAFCILLPFTRRSINFKTKMLLVGSVICIVGALNGSYLYKRVFKEKQKHIIGNLNKNSRALFVKDSLGSFVVFNPIKVMEVPFSHSYIDKFRRKYVWETLFKRGLFWANQHYRSEMLWICRTLSFFAMSVLVISFCGIAQSWRRPRAPDIPLLLLLFLGLGSTLLLRINVKNSGLADFRYVVFIAVPLAYFAVQRIWSGQRTWQRAGLFFVCGFLLSAVLFFGYLSSNPLPEYPFARLAKIKL